MKTLLERHFDTAFDAPDGIKRLRELILTLAMQGKLIKQDHNDPPASELIKEIEAEKKRLIKAGKIKQPKSLPPIKSEEVPYELPKSWQWVRLGEVGVWKSGTTPSRTNSKYYGGNIPWVKSGEVKQGLIKHAEEFITDLALKECSLSLNPKGSVLVAMYGANIGEVGILDIEATTNQAVCACQVSPKLNAQYLLNLIAASKSYFISQGAGAAQPNISREKIVATPFPLPPLPEQHRIVAKIDQLMARCDALEKLRTERNQKRLVVHAAAIRQLLDPASLPSRPQHVQHFLFSHFPELYAVKENVTEFRKAILQLAVMGKLVPQDPKDPPASELLKEIEAEKKRLIKAGKIKQPKPLFPIKPEEIPYDLPKSWEWVRLGDLFRVTSGENLTKDKMQEGSIPVFGGNGITGYHNRANTEKQTIVIGRVGYYCGSIHLTPAKAWVTDNAFFTIYDEERLYQSFVIWLFKTINLQVDTSSTAQPVISGSKIYPILIPLPPLAEQHRIVAKIDQLMALCDAMENQITSETNTQTALLTALMARV